jgi:hypothetical protein
MLSYIYLYDIHNINVATHTMAQYIYRLRKEYPNWLVNHHFPSENDGFFLVSGSIPVYPIFKPKQHERNHPGHEPWTSSISSVFSCRCKASLEARFHGPTSPRFIREATVNGFSYRKILVSSWDFSNVEWRLNQWPFQEPIDWRYLPYIFRPFCQPKFQEISPEFLWPEKWYIQYLHFRRRSPIDRMVIVTWKSRDGFMRMGRNMV